MIIILLSAFLLFFVIMGFSGLSRKDSGCTGMILPFVVTGVYIFLLLIEENLKYFVLCFDIISIIFLFSKGHTQNVRDKKRTTKKWKEGSYDSELRRKEYKEETKRKEELENLKKEIEIKAMNVSCNYEEEQNRTVEDVSTENLGYDLKSYIDFDVRFIEVKGKAETGEILLTDNEMTKAKELKDYYYLYIVLNCSSEFPKLYRIKNPANNLHFNYNSSTNKYSISSSEIIEMY